MMKLFLALLIGAVLAVMVPWYCASMPGQILSGAVDGELLSFTVGGESHYLHWSWLVFGVMFVLGFIALSAAEQKY